MYSESEILRLLPLAASWIEEQEAFILKNGSPLDEGILKDAGQLGIKNLEKVRFLAVDKIPHPSDKLLSKAISDFGFIGSNTLGVAFRYGIYVRTSHRHDRSLLIHELVHTMQYERIGGVLPFLNNMFLSASCMGIQMEAFSRKLSGSQKSSVPDRCIPDESVQLLAQFR